MEPHPNDRTLAPSRPRRKKRRSAPRDRGTPGTRRNRAQRLHDGPISRLRFPDLPEKKGGCRVPLKRLVQNRAVTREQGEAAMQIENICRHIEESHQIKTSSLGRVDFGNDPYAFAKYLDSRAPQWRQFGAWEASLKTVHKDAPQIVINIIVFGASLTDINLKYKKRKDDSFARNVLLNGLECWIFLKKGNYKKNKS